jgi:hypothetical protein
LAWQLRRTKGIKQGAYIARLAPQSSSAPGYIVPKAALEHSWGGLDSRGVFIIQILGTRRLRMLDEVTAVAACNMRRRPAKSVLTHLCR